MGHFVVLARLAELPEQGGLGVVAGRRAIALFRQGECVFALDDQCTHSGGPLSEGALRDGCVACPWHGAEFDLATGASRSALTARAVKAYPARVREGLVEVELPEG